MKCFILTMLTIVNLFALHSQNPINELYKYEKNGLVEEFYLSGELKCRCTVVDGKISSDRECFYKNGDVWVVEQISNGKFNGLNYLLNEKKDTVYIEKYH